MYPATFREDMPCGRGFEWTDSNGYLAKKLMCDKNISLSSIQWISSMENDTRFIDRLGKRCEIKYGWNSEEVEIGKYYVDGYCKVDEKEFALEFDGCYFHGCDDCKFPGTILQVILIYFLLAICKVVYYFFNMTKTR